MPNASLIWISLNQKKMLTFWKTIGLIKKPTEKGATVFSMILQKKLIKLKIGMTIPKVTTLQNHSLSLKSVMIISNDIPKCPSKIKDLQKNDIGKSNLLEKAPKKL